MRHGWLVLLLLCIAPRALAQAEFTVHPDRPIGPELVGFGAQMNPYLYCRPNTGDGGVDAASAKDLENKILALRPQHVRIFLLKQWFDGRADPISKGDPATVDSFYRVVDLAQRAGATVNLTYWYEPGWSDVPGQMRWFAELVADMLSRKRIAAPVYLTVQNEPNLHEDKISKELYGRLYLTLDAELKRAGIRKQTRVISGDLVQDNQEDWFAFLGSKLSGVSDGYSIHAYWDFWDTDKILRRLSLPRQIMDALPKSEQRPLFVTEFGVRGRNKDFHKNDPGDYEDGSPIATQPLQGMELGRFVLEGLNHGYVGFVVWTMDDALYDHPMQYGLIGGAKAGWPLKPGYHLLRLLTHTIEPGWRAVAVEGTGEGVVVSAVRGPKGEMTLAALNTTDQPQPAQIRRVTASMRSSFTWNADGRGTIAPAEQVRADANHDITVTIPRRAVVVTTTRQNELRDLAADATR